MKLYLDLKPYKWSESGDPNFDGVYVGKVKKGLPNDREGTLTYPDGRKYVGGIKDGTQNGQGTETKTDGRKYVGEFKEGERHGHGTYT